MRLTDASVAIRPRSAWEALDLGILLAHRHARLLMGSWALLTLPLFAVLSLLLWQHPTLAILIFWWLAGLRTAAAVHSRTPCSAIRQP